MAAIPDGNGQPSEVLLDVGLLLQRAASAMKPGELLHCQSFSLLESVTSVEIGNKRMDAGADHELRSAEQLVAAGGAPTTLDGDRIVAVMDRLLCLEAAWHLGHFLPQTVYTCLYMLLPDRAQGILPLAAFCKALRATCNTARSLTLVANVCMDEDIMPHAFGLNVEDKSCVVAGSIKPLAALNLAEEQLSSSSRQHPTIGVEAVRASNSHTGAPGFSNGILGERKPVVPPGGSPTATSDDSFTAEAKKPCENSFGAAITSAVREALLARLRFRKALHQALEKLLAFSAPTDLQAAAVLIKRAQSHLSDVRSTVAVAAAADDAVVARCFDAAVNRPLLTPMPPRRMPIPNLETSLQHFESMLANLLFACHISTVSTWRDLQAFLFTYRDRNPCHIERAVLHLVLRGGKAAGHGAPPPNSPPWTPRPDMTAAVVGLPNGPDAVQPCEEAQVFLEQATIVTQNWCQAMCLSPSRGRRRLRRLFEDWSHLYGHACVADASPQVVESLQAAGWGRSIDSTGPIALWVEAETASMLATFITAGCSQELYHPREYPALYWYLDYLSTVALEARLSIATFAPRSSQSPNELTTREVSSSADSSKASKPPATAKVPASGKRAGNTRKGKGAASRNKAPPCTSPLSAAPQQRGALVAAGSQAVAAPQDHLRYDAELRQALLSLGDVERHMSLGTFRAAVGAKLAGQLDEPKGAPPDAEVLRFQQRFAAFDVFMRPEPLLHEQYTEMMQTPGVQTQQLFRSAGQSMRRAKELARDAITGCFAPFFSPYEVKMLSGTVKTAQQNEMALHIICSTMTKESAGELRLTWSFKHHPHFPTLALKR